MAVIAEVSIGPLENTDGTKMVYPVVTRSLNFWVSWSEDPGDDFDLSTYGPWNSGSPDARQIHFERRTGVGWTADRLNSMSFLKRIGNQFQFRLLIRGIEGYARIRVDSNIHGGNAEATLEIPVLNYAPRVRSITLPIRTTPQKNADDDMSVIKRRNISFVVTSGRGRPTYFKKESFTLEGIINNQYYTGKDVIKSVDQPFEDSVTGEGYTQGPNRDAIVNVELPPESKGIARLRVERNSVTTTTNGFPQALKYTVLAGKGPELGPVISKFFMFDTRHDSTHTANTNRAIRLKRGIEGTEPTIHAENSQIIQIDQVIDVRDNRWVVKPLDELSWASDNNSLYNQIRIFYGNNKEYYQEDPQSVFENGARDFSMTVPLADHQSQWVRQIAQNLLTSFSKLQHIATLQLKLSLHLKLGHILYLRGLTTDAISSVVQIVGVEHSISEQFSLVTVRTINRPSPQTLSAPVFSLNLFTSSQTINLIVGDTYTARLVATGNPTPSITVTGNPSWLSVDRQGNIRARPTAEGTFTTTFTADNGQSPNATFILIFTAKHSNIWGSGDWNRFEWGT